MTHRGLVEVSGTVISGQLSVAERAQLAVRVNPCNARHHLWNNNGTWFVHYTVYPSPITARRIRRSLNTKSLRLAMQRRDQILSQKNVSRPASPPREPESAEKRNAEKGGADSRQGQDSGRVGYGDRINEAAFIAAGI